MSLGQGLPPADPTASVDVGKTLLYVHQLLQRLQKPRVFRMQTVQHIAQAQGQVTS